MTSLDDIFKNIEFIHPERRSFFYLWLQDHFGFVEHQRIEEYIETLGEEKAKNEINTVKSEYQWCRREPIERLRRICIK